MSSYEKEKLLTSREYDVLRLAAQGETNAGIGATLHISDAAVELNLTNIYGKMGLASVQDTRQMNRRVLAIMLGIKYQIISFDEMMNGLVFPEWSGFP